MMKSFAALTACAIALVTGCSGGSSNSNVARPSQPSESATAPSASAAPEAASGGACPLLANDQVEQVMHLRVQSVDVTSDPNRCTFHFQGGNHGDVEVTYTAQGGPQELDSVRKAGEGAHAIFGGIAKAASAPPGVMGMISATPPPDVAKVGDDQVFMNEGPVTQFYATKGDAYVEVDGGFMPEGVSPWVVLPEIAKQVLSGR